SPESRRFPRPGAPWRGGEGGFPRCDRHAGMVRECRASRTLLGHRSGIRCAARVSSGPLDWHSSVQTTAGVRRAVREVVLLVEAPLTAALVRGQAADVQPETRYAKSEDGHVGYQVVGNGPLDLVFVTSWASNVEVMWEEPTVARSLRRLATFSRLLCFDKRGSGVSDPVPLALLPTLEQWTGDVRTVMDAAGSKRSALLGYSEGGQMAMLFAATYPERTAALVLVNTSARLLRDVDYPWGPPADRVSRYLQRTEGLWGTGGLLDIHEPSVAHDEPSRRWRARDERLPLGPRPR